MTKLNAAVKEYTVVAVRNDVKDVPHNVIEGDRRITHTTRLTEVMAGLRVGQAVHLGGFMTKQIRPHVPGLPGRKGGKFELDGTDFMFTNISNAKAGKRSVPRERSIRRLS